MLEQRIDIEGMPSLGHDRDGHFFAEPVMGHPEDRCFVNSFEFVDHRFDFGAVDVLASAKNHVLGAILDEDETFLVDAPEIPALQPAVDDRIRRRASLVPIAADQVRSAEADLTDFAGSEGIHIFVETFHFENRHRAPRTARLPNIVIATILRTVGVSFGHAITKTRASALEALIDAAHHLRRGRGAAAADRSETRSIPRFEVRRFQEVDGHSGHAHELRDAFTFD